MEGDALMVSQGSALQTYIDSLMNHCLGDLGSPGTGSLHPQDARALAEAVDEGDWLPGPEHTRLRVRAHHLLLNGGIGRGSLQALPRAAEMAAHVRSHPDSAGGKLAPWIALVEPSASELLTAVSASL
ncbi:hypothetical protein [Streptomyces sp. NPDC055506]